MEHGCVIGSGLGRGGLLVLMTSCRRSMRIIRRSFISAGMGPRDKDFAFKTETAVSSV